MTEPKNNDLFFIQCKSVLIRVYFKNSVNLCLIKMKKSLCPL